jgi:hypothetical protein
METEWLSPAKAPLYLREGFRRRRLPDRVDGSWLGSGLGASVANLRDSTDLAQETITIVHRPNFDTLAAREKIHLHSGRGNQLSRGCESEEITAMCAAKREAVRHSFPFGNDVVIVDPEIREAFQQSCEVFSQPSDAGTNPAGISVVNHRVAVEREVAFEILDLKPKPGPLKRVNIFAWRHNGSGRPRREEGGFLEYRRDGGGRNQSVGARPS